MTTTTESAAPAPTPRAAAPGANAPDAAGAPIRVRGLVKRFGRLTALDGLDPLMERVFTEEVAAAAAAGRTVLLSSHILAEVQRLCGAVTIIKDGRVVEDGGLEHLQSLAATRIELRADPERLAALEAALAPLGADPERDGDRLVLQVGSQRVPEVLGAVAEQRIVDVRCEPASLEDLFLRHYEDAR